MGSAIMMYILPMMLGRTYDMGKDKPSIQIFSQSALNENVTIEHYFTDSQYRMVENSDEIKDFLDVSGKLSLKIKSGMLSVSGEGSYLKDSSSRSNSLEILVKVHFETVTQTLPTSAKPFPDWSLQDEKYLGTHYARSITFGGDLIATIRLIAKNSYDKERIKGAIEGGIKAGESFEAEVKAQLEKLTHEAQDSTSMEIDYFASVPIPGVSYSIDGLMDLVHKFPDHVKTVNNGLGVPLRMELYPLTGLKNSFPTYLENRALNDQLSELESEFDDLRATKRALGIWLNSLPPTVPDNVQEMIDDFMKKLDQTFGVFTKSIQDLDLSVGASMKPFENAFQAYKDGGNNLPEKYMREFLILEKEIMDKFREGRKIFEDLPRAGIPKEDVNERTIVAVRELIKEKPHTTVQYKVAPELKNKIGGATYIRWGGETCDSADIEGTVTGVGASSESSQNGGSSEFVCIPTNPTLKTPNELFPVYDPSKDSEDSHLFVSAIRYRGDLEKFKEKRNKMIACTICRANQRTVTMTKMAATSCPEKWTKEYEGIMMAPGIYSAKGQYICVDNGLKTVEEVNFGLDQEDLVPEVQEVTIKCGALPCGPYKENAAIPCVVCTL